MTLVLSLMVHRKFLFTHRQTSVCKLTLDIRKAGV